MYTKTTQKGRKERKKLVNANKTKIGMVILKSIGLNVKRNIKQDIKE